jgi:hypothetical protein
MAYEDGNTYNSDAYIAHQIYKSNRIIFPSGELGD